MYDVAIVGAGPAGLSAALNLQLHGKSIVWFGSRSLSTKVEKAEQIANYPGIPQVRGADLNVAFLRQIDEAGLVLTEEMVTNITPMGESFMLLANGQVYEAKAVLLATGAVTGKGFAGEEQLLGSGVSYCATCDGFLYRGKTVAVYCGAQQFAHEVTYLADIAEKVYLFSPPGVDVPAHAHIVKAEKPLRSINGQMRVTSVTLTDGSDLAVDGVFVLRSAVAPATLLPGLEMDGVHIAVDRRMATNYPGCFAAGDCTGRPYQIAIAVGQGNTAAHAILEHLAK